MKRIFKSIFQDNFLRDSFIMFTSSGLVNFFNFLYTIFLARELTPSDFGLFNSLLAILMLILQVPSAISIAVSRFVSQYHAQESFEKIKKIIYFLNKRINLLVFFIFLGIILFHKPGSNFLKISDGANFLILGFIILFSYLSAIPQATLLGLQKFFYLSFSSVFSGLIKLIMVFLLIKLGMEVKGALGAFLISSLFGFILLLYFQHKSLPKILRFSLEENLSDLRNIYAYFIPFFIATLIGTGFMNIDIILVKKFFEPLYAGYYSISQVVGKVVFFFPSSIVTVMFPKVAHFQAKNSDTKILLKKSILYTFFLSSLIATMVIIFPDLTLKILVGKIYYECFPFVRLFAVNMVLLSIIFIFLNYYLSLNRQKYLYIFLIAFLFEILLISLFHQSILQVLFLIFFLFFFLFLFNFWINFYYERNRR